ncbi:MAG TPA: MotA/TolQ/ExbB proton channel family protein [Stellaceae bacterium]|nr:MotA/TolQ/ExbB proton channel family protein [Stellaceae bacterium]
MKSIALSLAVLLMSAIFASGAMAQTPAPSSTPPAATQAPAAPSAPTTVPPPPATTTAPSAATPAPAIALPEQPAQETVDNPYSLTALWEGGDFIARGTIIILLIMSIGSWYVMITKFVEQALLLHQGRQANRKFWNAPSIRAGADSLGGKSAYRMVVEDGLKAVEHHEGKLTEQIDRHTWITMSLQRAVDSISNRLQGGLAVLATVGSTAPFVGLFGTVWGIYHALTAIGIAGQASIDKVAGPVGEALIMTAIGLAVAVPAVLGYNWMVRRNKVAMDQLRSFSGDLLALLIAGATTAPKPAVRSA